MTTESRPALIATAILGLLVACGLWLFGCSLPSDTGPAVVTPRYGIPVSSTVAVDLDELDAAWADTVACYGYTGPYLPIVAIREDCRPCEGSQCFPCRAETRGRYEWCAGLQLGTFVQLCPDLAADRYEFEHVAEGLLGINTFGDDDAHRPGCRMVGR